MKRIRICEVYWNNEKEKIEIEDGTMDMLNIIERMDAMNDILDWGKLKYEETHKKLKKWASNQMKK